MAYSHTAQGRGHGHGSTSVYAPAETTHGQSSAPAPCGCSNTEPSHTCCDLVCFERPEYFCGHLLTDSDLSLDQRYVREKHKLYHRALHGHGIVCGLRLTCDSQCRGHVVIGEGYAIDDCGNDLVVCEPMSFNVIGRLREKKLLYRTPTKDDCQPGKPEDDCRIRQCFYVTACFDEEPQEFATPLGPSCGPSSHVCEPTRVRETVRFEVVDRLPKVASPLDELECRMERCFALFTEGPFAEELKKQVVRDISEEKADPGSRRHKEFCDAVCRLRLLLKLHLDAHPDHYNCTIVEDLDAIGCPAGPDDDGFTRETYAADFRSAICRIVDLAYGHVAGCVLGELAFPCAAPSKASCVVLGTVEVEGDRVVRVCNCPRNYVWSFASFFQVLMATLFGRQACESVEQTGYTYDRGGSYDSTREPPGHDQQHTHDDDCGCGRKHGPKTCCRQLTPREGCASLLHNLSESGGAIAGVGTATLGVIKEVTRSLQHFLDPTRTDVTLLGALRGSYSDQVRSMLAGRNVEFTFKDPPSAPLQPLEALTSLLHFAPAAGGHVVIHEAKTPKGNVVVGARPETLQEQVARLELELRDMRRQLGDQASSRGRGADAAATAPPGQATPPPRKGRRQRKEQP